MRNKFIEYLYNYASNKKDLYLLVGDLGYSVIEQFVRAYPDQFVNCGVAEQLMMSLASGLVAEGGHAFAYSIANFPTYRCAEQIRNDIDYHCRNVTIVAVGGGVAYGNLGYSHHAIQDFGLMRCFPNMLIMSPCDPNELVGCLDYILDNPQPSYLRINKAGEENYNSKAPILKPGMWNKLANGDSDKVILITGTVAKYAKRLKKEKFNSFSIYSVPMWGSKFKTSQVEYLHSVNELVVIEEHLEDCGFGSWILESVPSSLSKTINIHRYALDSEVCGVVGTQSQLIDNYLVAGHEK